MSRRLAHKVYFVIVLLAAQGLAVLVYLGIERHQTRKNKEPLLYERVAPGQQAPDFVLSSSDGSVRKLSDLRGKTVLLHFWATWCPPCRKELPTLLAFGRDLSRNGNVELIAVTLDEDWDAVRKFLGGKIPREIVQDGSQSSISSYDLSKLPETYLIAPDGTLQLRFRGAADWSDRRTRNLIPH